MFKNVKDMNTLNIHNPVSQFYIAHTWLGRTLTNAHTYRFHYTKDQLACGLVFHWYFKSMCMFSFGSTSSEGCYLEYVLCMCGMLN